MSCLSSTTWVFDPVNSPQDAAETFVAAEGEYWDDTVRVKQDAHSGVSRRDLKRTHQVFDEVQASDKVGPANTSGTIHNKAQVYTGIADCRKKTQRRQLRDTVPPK